MAKQEMNSDVLVRVSHLGLWIALATVLYAGGAILVLLLGEPDTAEMARKAMFLLPIGNAIAIGALRMKAGKAHCASSPAMQAVMNDELRQQALAKGYRNGFFAAMVAAIASALAVSLAGVAKGPSVMMVAIVTVGVAVMLGSVLYHDR